MNGGGAGDSTVEATELRVCQEQSTASARLTEMSAKEGTDVDTVQIQASRSVRLRICHGRRGDSQQHQYSISISN